MKQPHDCCRLGHLINSTRHVDMLDKAIKTCLIVEEILWKI